MTLWWPAVAGRRGEEDSIDSQHLGGKLSSTAATGESGGNKWRKIIIMAEMALKTSIL